MIEEEEVVELASIATERVTWQEIVLMVIEGIADEVAGVVLEAEVVEEIEHVTIATKRVTWLENARKKIAEIVVAFKNIVKKEKRWCTMHNILDYLHVCS